MWKGPLPAARRLAVAAIRPGVATTLGRRADEVSKGVAARAQVAEAKELVVAMMAAAELANVESMETSKERAVQMDKTAREVEARVAAAHWAAVA